MSSTTVLATNSSSGSISSGRQELTALTGIRFFAAAFVVLYHFLFPNLPQNSWWGLRNVLSAGYSAVGFFFMLSGFVLTYSYHRAKQNGSFHKGSFWKSRFTRIYPAYVFAFLLAAPFQVLGSLHANGLHLALKKLMVGAVLVLTLTQAWTPWTVWYWNIPAWSLSVEAFFYLCFPFLLLFVAGRPAKSCFRWMLAVWAAGLLAPLLYSMAAAVVAQPPFPMPQLAVETNPILRLPDFVLGMLLGRIFVSGFRWNARLAAGLAVLASVALFSLLAFSALIPRLLLSNGLLVPASAVLIFALAQQAGGLAKFLGHPLLRLFGEASYAVYILQFPVASLVHLNSQTFTAARFLVYLATLLVVSLLTFKFIEQPLHRRRRKSVPATDHSFTPLVVPVEANS